MTDLKDHVSDAENPHAWATIGSRDRELFEHHLKTFVPPKTFDAHAHLWRLEDLGVPAPPLAAAGPSVVDRGVYAERVSSWMPERCPSGGLFFPFPTRHLNVEAANQFLADQLKNEATSRGLMIVTPDQDPAEVERLVREGGFAGFKVYHLFASRPETMSAPIEEFLPEWAWEIAHQRDLSIMLHMVLPRALAEPANQSSIREHCRRYHRAKLILAHAARGFCGRHTVEGISTLRGLENVFFDSSAICEPEALEAILQTFGPTRLLFGTDFCVSEMRSRCVSLGDGFLWLDELGLDLRNHRHGQPTLLGLESLLALKQACRNQHLTDRDVEEVFSLAARRLLGVSSSENSEDVQAAYRAAKQIIPGGTQLLSKRPEMFAPEHWPAYYREARGCEVIDLEGRRFLDMSLGGILSCLLGYSDPEVNAAVHRRVDFGSMSTLQTHDEVELARLLIEIHPWAQCARFTRSGGETMAVAVRIARASTGRDRVAVCGYHGWHDWYLAANLASSDQLAGHLLPGLEPKGVPKGLAGSVQTFRYNRLEELDEIIKRHGNDLAAVVMEPTRHVDPEPGFLEGVRERCDRLRSVLIFDEISIGWRLCLGGAHLRWGVPPDLAVFAKALGNGYPIGAVIGTNDVMQAAQESFISSTFWTEGIGPAAAVACLRKQKQLDVPGHLAHIGSLVIDGWQRLGRKHQVPVKIAGRPEMALLSFEHPDSTALITLMTVRMLRHRFLAGGAFNAMLAHEPWHVAAYLDALDDVFAELAAAIREDDVLQRIGGLVKQTGFTRLT